MKINNALYLFLSFAQNILHVIGQFIYILFFSTFTYAYYFMFYINLKYYTMRNTLNRRQFLSSAAIISAAGATGAGSLLTSCSGGSKTQELIPLKPADQLYIPTLTDKAADGKPLRAGVIGCGGRGSGATMNFLAAADNLTISALCDTFQDKLDNLKGQLKEKKGIEVADANCFVGFDGFQKLIDCPDVDVVIMATPPVFRPLHFKACVDAGKHCFIEKPIAVDPVGARIILTAAKQAEAKGLCVVTGTQRHHQRSYVEAYKQVQSGLIGEITGANVYWNQNMLWYRTKEAAWTNMEWMIRDWVNWTWLSGDHIVEQHVHNIDVFTWFSGKKPVKAVAFGSRQRRLTGNQYDNFSVDFTYEGGIHVHSMCRQIDGCAGNVSEFIQGSKGSFDSSDMTIRDLAGNILWQYDKETEKQFQQNDPYTLEHVNWITHIRSGQPICQAEETANSCIAAVMGRESAYTGKEVTWDEMMSSAMDLMPAELAMDNAIDPASFKVPVPGSEPKAKA